MRRLAVIGEGVAATAFLYALTQKANVDKFSSIIHFGTAELAPATSLRSTAIAALRGTRAGLSPLGDEIVEMWHHTHPLFLRERWRGLKAVNIETWVYSDKADRRYGHLERIEKSIHRAHQSPRYRTTEPGWIIEPATLLKNVPRPPVDYRPNLVTSLAKKKNGWAIGFLGGTVDVDDVVLATGAWSDWTRELFVGSPLENMKNVQGSFYQWERTNYGESHFVLNLEGMVCVYHADERRLILGATSISGDETFVPHLDSLKKIREDFLSFVDFDLPVTKPAIITGLRAQTKGRRPWAGRLDENLYAIGGLYKTGWVTAWPLGEKLANSI